MTHISHNTCACRRAACRDPRYVEHQSADGRNFNLSNRRSYCKAQLTATYSSSLIPNHFHRNAFLKPNHAGRTAGGAR